MSLDQNSLAALFIAALLGNGGNTSGSLQVLPGHDGSQPASPFLGIHEMHPGYAEITVILPGGEVFRGRSVPVRRPAAANAPASPRPAAEVAAAGGSGSSQPPPPAPASGSLPESEAKLTGNRGGSMKCRLRAAGPHGRLTGGGSASCSLPDGSMLQFTL